MSQPPIIELYKAICRPAALPAASSPSTPRRWGSTPIATGSAWCSSPKATAAPCWCSSPASYDAPELKRLLADQSVLKIFHFGRFDMAVLKHYLGVMPRPVYCTKVASKLARTFTDRHGLKDLCQELLGIELSKQQQSSDWGAAELTQEQLNYAASDVLHLHALREKLDAMLRREGREGLARACFEFLPTRAELDLRGWSEIDPFAH